MLNKKIIDRFGKILKYVKDVSLVFNLCDFPMSKRAAQGAYAQSLMPCSHKKEQGNFGFIKCNQYWRCKENLYNKLEGAIPPTIKIVGLLA